MNLLLGSALHGLRRRSRLAAIALGAGAFVLAACQAQTSQSSPGALPGVNTNRSVMPNAAPTFSFVPYVPTLPTVPTPDNVDITGINSNDNPGNTSTRITGVYFNNATQTSATPAYHSFIAQETNTTSPCATGWGCPIPDPSATPSGSNIYINELSAAQADPYNFSVGYTSPYGTSACGDGQISPTCGIIYDPTPLTSGGPSHIYQVNVGSCATRLYGTSYALIQVGYYYKGTNCAHAQAFEEYLPPHSKTPLTFDFHLPPSWNVNNSYAYGINNKGDVVGAYTASGGNGFQIGWEYDEFCYSKIQVTQNTSTGAFLSTQARGINWDGIVVGTYEEPQTNSKTTPPPNGFVESGGTPYHVNDGTNGTVINNINNEDIIVGYHIGGGMHRDHMGFIGTCKASAGCPAGPPPPSISCAGTGDSNDSTTRRRP